MEATGLRWGILGLGRIAESFAKGLSFSPGAKLVAEASRSQAKAEAFGARWGVPKRHGSWEALADDPDVDAVYVATPHPLHFSNAARCLEGGKAVLCEKPFTMNAWEAETLVAEARKRKLLLMEAMWTRFLPHMVELRKLALEGAIGQPRALHADFGFRCDGNEEGRLLNPSLGGGALLDVGVYTISLARTLLGPFAEMKAVARIGRTGVDEDSSILLRFPSGAIATLNCSIMTRTAQEATLYGDAGRIKAASPWWSPSSLSVLREGSEREEIVAPGRFGNGYNYEADEFRRCFEAGLLESPSMTHADSLAVMRCLDEARRQIGLKYPFER